jgi:hypothetical protein
MISTLSHFDHNQMKEFVLILVILLFGGFFWAAVAGLFMTIASIPGGIVWKLAYNRRIQFLKPIAFLLMYFPMAYIAIAFVTIWIQFTRFPTGLFKLIIWPLTFIVCMAPSIWGFRVSSSRSLNQQEFSELNGLRAAWLYVFLTALIAFFVIAIDPSLAHPLWGWVIDYVGAGIWFETSE